MMIDGTGTPPGRFAATLPIEGREGASSATNLVSRRRAKQLRRQLTGPEAKLWVHLKRIKTIDTHFRKQVSIGRYIADLACLRSRLIIEVDGEQHGFDAGRRADERRTRFLEAEGFSVLRFWNHEVLQDMNSVLDTIYAKLYGAPDAPARSASKMRGLKGEAPSSPSMGEVPSVSEAEGVTLPGQPKPTRRP